MGKPGITETGRGKPYLNEKKFEHSGAGGIVLTCSRCDLRDVIQIRGLSEHPSKMRDQWLAMSVATVIGFHAVNIRPELDPQQGFAGYDSLRFEIV